MKELVERTDNTIDRDRPSHGRTKWQFIRNYGMTAKIPNEFSLLS
jgi:hypothetical protein